MRTEPTSRPTGAASRLHPRDLVSEALAGLLQRPGRSVLTMLGTVLGIGGFVAIVGLSQTASGQIGSTFNRLDATQVTVADTAAGKAAVPTLDFPPNADALVDRINGVIAAGVWWNVVFTRAAVSARPPADQSGQSSQLGLQVTAATPGALAASGAKLQSGILYGRFHESRAQRVAVIGAAAASQLGISNLQDQPAIFIQGQSFTVIGILSSDERIPQLNFGVSVPASTALRLWGRPQSSSAAQMIIHTRLGAAQVVAKQATIALRPDDPKLLTATAPASPAQLQHSVTTSLNTLFLALAGIAVIVGMIGIANTTLVAVLERVGEIGLRRALGARPVHIAAQFLAESTALGLLGGLIGASIGVVAVLAVTVYHSWTALLDPRVVLAAPVAGAVIGLLAGLYPALRAGTVEPADALRR
ncbi:MAG TPA: ABC transporter permease [Streptosporangiaceae bacterium]|nr:ABC transporter permease [Streptosporangiaceae bacterium]